MIAIILLIMLLSHTLEHPHPGCFWQNLITPRLEKVFGSFGWLHQGWGGCLPLQIIHWFNRVWNTQYLKGGRPPGCLVYMGVSKNRWKNSQIIDFNMVWNHYKPSILGVSPYFWVDTRTPHLRKKFVDLLLRWVCERSSWNIHGFMSHHCTSFTSGSSR